MKNLFMLYFWLVLVASGCTRDDFREGDFVKEPRSGKIGLTPIGVVNNPIFSETNSYSDASNWRVLYCEWGWVYTPPFGVTWGIIWCNCFWRGGTCLDDVVITANREAYNNFKENFDNGTLDEYFSTNEYQSIFSGLDELGIVDELQNGEITFYLKQEVELNRELYIGLPSSIEYNTTDTSWMSETRCVLVFNTEE